MPNIKSAMKRVRVNEAKAAANKSARSAFKTRLKRFDAAISAGSRSEAELEYTAAIKAVDKAAARGLIHRNNAAHKKSSMTLKLNKM